MDDAKNLRDEFAMVALQALTNGLVQPDRQQRERAARTAFAFADEMLAAREIAPEQLKLLVR